MTRLAPGLCAGRGGAGPWFRGRVSPGCTMLHPRTVWASQDHGWAGQSSSNTGEIGPGGQISTGEPRKAADGRWREQRELLCGSEWQVAWATVTGAQPHRAVGAAHLTSGRRCREDLSASSAAAPGCKPRKAAVSSADRFPTGPSRMFACLLQLRVPSFHCFPCWFD